MRRSHTWARRGAVGVAAWLLAAVGAVGAAERPLAEVRLVEGVVRVEHEKGRVPAQPGLDLNPGYRVEPAPKSRALVVYRNGCMLEVRHDRPLEVRDEADCCSAVPPLETESEDEPVATLQEKQGPVLVNTGERVVGGEPGQLLYPGELVEAAEGGRAVVVYRSGCAIEVDAGERLKIDDDPNCCALAALLESSTGAPLGAAVAGGTAGGTLFVGGTLGTVGIVGAIAGGGGKKAPPISGQ